MHACGAVFLEAYCTRTVSHFVVSVSESLMRMKGFNSGLAL